MNPLYSIMDRIDTIVFKIKTVVVPNATSVFVIIQVLSLLSDRNHIGPSVIIVYDCWFICLFSPVQLVGRMNRRSV